MNNINITKLVYLYKFCKFETIPKYLLDNKEFVLKRCTTLCESNTIPKSLLANKEFVLNICNTKIEQSKKFSLNNIEDLVNKLNNFKYDKNFISDVFKIMNDNNIDQIYIYSKFYSKILCSKPEIILYLIKKNPILYLSIIKEKKLHKSINNLFNDIEFLKFILKNLNTKAINNYIDAFYILLKNNKELVYLFIKYINVEYQCAIFNFFEKKNINSWIFNNKIIQNIILKRDTSLKYEDITKKFNDIFNHRNGNNKKILIILESLKTNKSNILKFIDKIYFGDYIINYFNKKYGSICHIPFIDNELYKLINTIIYSDKNHSISLSMNKLINMKNKDVVIFIFKRLFELNNNNIMSLFYYSIMNKKDLFKLFNYSLNNEFMKSIYRNIYKNNIKKNNYYNYTNLLSYSSSYNKNFPILSIEDKFNLINFKKELIPKLNENILYNIKFIEKIIYYNSIKYKIFRFHDILNRMKFVNSKLDDYSIFNVFSLKNKGIKNISKYYELFMRIYNSPNYSEKIKNKAHYLFILNINSCMYCTNYDMTFNYIKQIQSYICNNINHDYKNNKIALESLKKDEKLIIYCDIKYINEYVENEFDISKIISKLENISIIKKIIKKK